MSDETTPAETWRAVSQTLYRGDSAVGTLDSETLAEWVADACNTLAEMDQAQAEWKTSGESAGCAMVDIGGEQMRMQGAAKVADRAEIEREIRAQIADEQAAWLPEILHVVWGFATREHTGTAQLTPWHAEEALRHVPGAILDAARVRPISTQPRRNP